LKNARWSDTATLLPNGHVLVAGGFDGPSDLASAEWYDPRKRPLARYRQHEHRA
jgi:hypothetical protein